MSILSHKPKKILRMHRLSTSELGSSRMMMMSLLAGSPDPFASVMYTIDAEPSKKLTKEVSSKTGRKITLTHVINKLIALAIAENPIFNQVILGADAYQMEEIHITNAFLLPGGEQALSTVVLENPHLKPLETIQVELKTLMDEKIREHAKPQNPVVTYFTRLCLKMSLFRLVGEKRIFTWGFERGLQSNILLANHVFKTPANYIVIKPVISPMKVALRIHSSGNIHQSTIENGKIINKEMISLHVIIDHRILHGVHCHQFGQSLKRLSSNPEKYLL